ncbi:acyltransferase [Grimontia marina]|uniref:Serine/alanine racemase n=1 Tax=Grimontia marina TaxID=646534 RepID=A0A128FFK7_9GAMM|nr:acyltransferase family protein [Grimontia marina]CZF85583.1 Serine/alanine racemase [Grimontia marina]
MSNARIPSLEMGRLLAILAVVIIHAGPFRGEAYSEGVNTLSDVINQICRFAVPFFFVLTGYFVQPKLVESPTKTFMHYAKPLMLIWLAWSIIYLVMPFRLDIAMTEGYLVERAGYWNYLLKAPFNTLFEGGLVHLWYIPGLLSALGILALLINKNQQGLIMPLALGLYVWGLGAGSYQPVMEGEAPIFTRNGPFFSLLMVTTGFEMRRRNISFSNKAAYSMLIGGLALCLAEGFNLTRYDVWMANHDFLVGTPLVALGLFALLLNHPNLGNNPATFALSKRVLGIYVAHFVPLILVFNLLGMYNIEGPLKDALVTPLTIAQSLGLVWLLEKMPITRFMVQMTGDTTKRLTSAETAK